MSEIFRCGDNGALVGYLYDECEPDERQAIAAHVSQCSTCADELDTLAGTRRLLSSWIPPEARLGFRVTRGSADTVVAPGTTPFGGREWPQVAAATHGSGVDASGWWRQPLPAWAQVAAAALIFAAGLAAGSVRGGPATASTAVVAPPSSAAVHENLAALERRVAGVEQMARVRPGAMPVAAVRLDTSEIMRRVREEIAASESRQYSELVVKNFELAEEQNKRQLFNNEQIKADVDQRFTGVFHTLASQR